MDTINDYTFYREFFSSITPLSDEEWESFSSLLYTKTYKRKEVFHQAGKVCSTVGFIRQGSFRSVRDMDGSEKTFDFAVENEFITDYYSIITRAISEVNIIAIEESTVVCADAQKMLTVFDLSMSWQKIGRYLAEFVACYYQERLISSYYETPKIRYERMMKNSPKLFLRIPHHMLANYLGLTKETLSRLRNPARIS